MLGQKYLYFGKWDGSGENQNGGITFTTKGDAVSPTKTISLTPTLEVEIDQMLSAMGRGGSDIGGKLERFSDRFEKIANGFEKLDDALGVGSGGGGSPVPSTKKILKDIVFKYTDDTTIFIQNGGKGDTIEYTRKSDGRKTGTVKPVKK
ncbi:MAG: hypothetical protein ACI8RY_001007 [Urechidicola sp.]|jgi:hypothetical protein|tara:strand:- start:1835 stop:2281 length:447 start_codon:yes stop_codon:yes gene_type:complete